MNISRHITRENITLLIAIIGAIGSISSWIYMAVANRKNVSFEIVDYASHFKEIKQLFVFLQNKSSIPIVITSIQFRLGNRQYPCELIPKKILEKADRVYSTPMFPINLSPHYGESFFLEFINCQDILLAPENTVYFVIYTNRGVINKSLTLGETSHYLHKK